MTVKDVVMMFTGRGSHEPPRSWPFYMQVVRRLRLLLTTRWKLELFVSLDISIFAHNYAYLGHGQAARLYGGLR